MSEQKLATGSNARTHNIKYLKMQCLLENYIKFSLGWVIDVITDFGKGVWKDSLVQIDGERVSCYIFATYGL